LAMIRTRRSRPKWPFKGCVPITMDVKRKWEGLDWSIVVAMAPNRVIGKNNQLPWHYKEDLRWFRQLTKGHTVLMGRKTYQSIGKALPHRRNLVLSKQQLTLPDAEVLASLEQAIALTEGMSHVFVIGGERIYKQTLPCCSKVYLTRIKVDYEGDTFFPSFEHQFRPPEVLLETEELIIEKYVR